MHRKEMSIMKSLKKLLCFLLALAVCLGLSIAAFAAGEDSDTSTTPHNMEGPDSLEANGTITIKNAAPTEVYKIYQIFYLESYVNDNTNPPDPGDPTSPTDSLGNLTGGNYVYQVNSAWKEFAERADINGESNYLTIDGQGYVTWNGDATRERAGEFAKLALAYAKEKNLEPIAEEIAPLTPQKNADGTVKTDENGKTLYEETSTVTFGGLKLGYYLVDTSLGSLCALDTTNPSVVMQEKNTVPTNVKLAQENGQWQSTNDAEIGDVVNFMSFIELASGIDHLIFHDTMSAGLTFLNAPERITVVLDATNAKETTRETNLVPVEHYNVVTTEPAEEPDTEAQPLADGCTFHIEFTDAFYELITTGDHTLTITYSATLNTNAVIGEAGNKNTSKISYGDGNHFTPDSDTYTKTWEVPILKYTLTGASNTIETPLSGAVFKLSTDKEGTEETPAAPISLIDLGSKSLEVGTDADGNPVTETWHIYRLATPDEIANQQTTENPDGIPVITEITTDSTGRFRIQGLDSGTYYLHEITAPNGYNKLSASIPIQIKDGKLKQNESEVSTIKVQNGTGSELPSTGGIGTTIFYVIGSILLVGTGILLITKKRMSTER